MLAGILSPAGILSSEHSARQGETWKAAAPPTELLPPGGRPTAPLPMGEPRSDGRTSSPSWRTTPVDTLSLQGDTDQRSLAECGPDGFVEEMTAIRIRLVRPAATPAHSYARP